MNRKFLYAQRNHETGSSVFADLANCANQEIERLRKRYNTQLNGKWNQMISEIPPGFCAKYQLMPEFCEAPTDAYKLPADQFHPDFSNKIDLSSLAIDEPFRLLDGIGTDWKALQLGQPLDMQYTGSINIPIPSNFCAKSSSIILCISVVPMWPVSTDRSNRFAVSVDDSEPQICENKFKEWGHEWKIQVLENRKEFVLTFPLDMARQEHIITLSIIDPGQIIQKITYNIPNRIHMLQ